MSKPNPMARRKGETTAPMQKALDAIEAGSTWAAAAKKFGVTESGILRAMRRLGLR